MAENQRLVFYNGRMIPEQEATVSIYDSALMFGDMVFEMTRSFNKEQFMLRAHLERLYDSIKYLRIPMEMSIEEMEQHCHQVVEANEPFFGPDDEHRLMIDVSRGILGLYHRAMEGNHLGTNVIISDFPLRWTVEHYAEIYDSGLEAAIPSQRVIPGSLLEPKVKNRSRIHYLMANIEVSNYKGENVWALMLDPDGFIAEGSGSNFFILKDGSLYTPEPRNILRGISRQYVFTLAEQLGIPCVEKNIEAYDVYIADEAFFTSTPFCMLPVVKLNGENIGEGTVGPLYQTLMDKWSKNVDLDIIGQIREYAKKSIELPSNASTPYKFRN